MKSTKLLGAIAALMLGGTSFAYAEAITLEGGKATNMVLLPKFLGILVFDQANAARRKPQAELAQPGKLQFIGPTPENSVAGQIEMHDHRHHAEAGRR